MPGLAAVPVSSLMALYPRSLITQLLTLYTKGEKCMR